MNKAIRYEIRISDILDKEWETHFAPFQLFAGDNETYINGDVYDQAELFGILLNIRDLGLQLVSVNPIPRP
jgi:hypothetical protein